jgi:hypothetical protein
MDICSILNLDCIFSTLDEPPKLALDVILADLDSADLADHGRIEHALFFCGPVGGRMALKPEFAESEIAGLEGWKGMFLAFIESKFVIGTVKARMAEPLAPRYGGKRWIETESVIAWNES